MLKNRVYVGDMVQGRTKKVSYKSKICKKLPKDQWIVVENTHEPIVSKEIFDKVNLLLESRKKTRARTYDYLLKGIIHCKECGSHLAVINRPNSRQDTVLYFVCRTYQRFTKSGVCTSHTIKEERVTNAIAEHIRDICRSYLSKELIERAVLEVKQEIEKSDSEELEIKRLQSEIDKISKKMDIMYQDRLSGVLDDEDFSRIYSDMKKNRNELQQQLEKIIFYIKQEPIIMKDINALAEKFINEANTNKELLVSLVEKIEFCENKKATIYFRCGSLQVMDMNLH